VSSEPTQLEQTLEQLGLTKTEAKVYLCLLDRSPLPASSIADLAGTSRSAVYLVLRSLVGKGLIDAGAGYSSRYYAAQPQRALESLLERDRIELADRERHVHEALPELTELFENNHVDDEELVEILRTPTLIGERFDRLQSEAQQTIDIVVRGPLQVGGPNEAELAALRRGVRARAIYDRNVLTEPSIDRNLTAWTTQGEQARLYPGDLPMKFAVFDSHTVLMPLVAPGVTGMVAIIVRNPELAATLTFLFDTLWERSELLENDLASSTLGPASRRSGDTPRNSPQLAEIDQRGNHEQRRAATAQLD
jgi:HTH-type transcriptional regulator, sugar sensing transcriptional regulator